MGIKNLRVILAQKCQLAITQRKLDNYSGMILGIDLSIFLYKYLYNNDDHIEGLTRLTLRLLKNNITPIYVFDGKPPKEKDGTLLERKEKKIILNIKKNLIDNSMKSEKDNFEKFKTEIMDYINAESPNFAINDDDIKNLFEKSNEELEQEFDKICKKIIYVTSAHITSAKKLFDLFGVGYIHAPCEAESLLAVLSKQNLIDGCISEDTDILANGGFLFLRNLSADKNIVDEYCLEGILQSLEFTHDQFIDMCILCGCDYLPKIIGMGPISAYKLISKFKTIEVFLENNTKFIIPEDFDYAKARYLFKNPLDLSLIEDMKSKIKITLPNVDELKDFLKNTKLKEKFINEIDNNLMSYFLSIQNINNLEKSLSGSYKTESKKITDFFSKV